MYVLTFTRNCNKINFRQHLLQIVNKDIYPKHLLYYKPRACQPFIDIYLPTYRYVPVFLCITENYVTSKKKLYRVSTTKPGHRHITHIK
jgi:hypothetical protein